MQRKTTSEGRSVRERALALLARREYSRQELFQKLTPHAESVELLNVLLDDLERRKMLSDARYAEARATVLGRKFGAARIEHELQAKGVAAHLIDGIARNARASELERARVAWSKRFGSAPTDALERAKQMRFLRGRGFSFETIRVVVGRTDDEDHA